MRSSAAGANPAAASTAQMGFDTASVDAEYDIQTGLTLATHTKAVSNITTPTPQGPAHTVANTDQTLTLQSS